VKLHIQRFDKKLLPLAFHETGKVSERESVRRPAIH
jgi:hypothetical protein